MVDLPGYGYAKVTRTLVEKWTKLTRRYLQGRPSLMRVYLLVDSRHGLKPSDEDLMKELNTAAVSYQIVLTKADKCKKTHLDAVLADTQARLKKQMAAHPTVLLTSAEKGDGIEQLRSEIGKFVEKS